MDDDDGKDRKNSIKKVLIASSGKPPRWQLTGCHDLRDKQ